MREVKEAAFATVDQFGKPQVRIIDVMLVEDEKLYFCTARGKNFYKELISTGDIAVTTMNKQFQMIRLQGNAKHLDDSKKWIDRIFEENQMMNEVYPGSSRYILEPFCIEKGEIELFDLGKTPVSRKTYSIGDEIIKEKGFFITTECIECDRCAQECPQHCIKKDSPYKIEQSNCLHCGLCYENCPVQAIIRR
jgi:uncharacterized pyridoxamine 5'-phosphate oxidase family protein/NAD-dependent dihydropyrimidine dehydrogenase PreA subunit